MISVRKKSAETISLVHMMMVWETNTTGSASTVSLDASAATPVAKGIGWTLGLAARRTRSQTEADWRHARRVRQERAPCQANKGALASGKEVDSCETRKRGRGMSGWRAFSGQVKQRQAMEMLSREGRPTRRYRHVRSKQVRRSSV